MENQLPRETAKRAAKRADVIKDQKALKSL